ncbi:hypothetical protein KY385_04050 [Candidatus Parcubacteria bacterium]|nr:hypothetical protein [Candidatus Parcubacteria bacterium]
MAPHRADEIGMRIGDEDVVFGAQYVAKEGSLACDDLEGAKPQAEFGEPSSFKNIREEGAAKPDFRGRPLRRNFYHLSYGMAKLIHRPSSIGAPL